MKPEYDLGDILIKRVLNGWIAVTSSHYTEDANENPVYYVYEDSNNEHAIGESLCNLLKDQFDCYMQSKRQPGIKMEYSNLSKEQQEELDYLTKNHDVK